MHWDSYFVFIPKDPRSKIYVEVYDGIVLIWIWKRVAQALQIQWWVRTVMFFFWDFLGRSGLLENWIQPYIRRHCCSCSLRPGTLLNSPCKLASSPLVVIDPKDIGWQQWLPRPDAWPSSTYPQSRIPAFLPMVIKLVCVCVECCFDNIWFCSNSCNFQFHFRLSSFIQWYSTCEF